MTKTTKKHTTKKSKLILWGYVWRLIVSLAIPLGVGGLSALISGDSIAAFGSFNQPPLAPPAWLFPVAWTILYILMSIDYFLIWIQYFCVYLANRALGNDSSTSHLGRQKSPRRHVATPPLSIVGDVRRLSKYYDCNFELNP